MNSGRSGRMIAGLLLVLLVSIVTGLDLAIARPVVADLKPVEKVEVTVGETTPMCRFGVNVLGNVALYDTIALRMGWYHTYEVNEAPATPNGADFIQVVRLKQTASPPYWDFRSPFTTSIAIITRTLAANPGAVWLIGNEPDRPYDFAGQDNMEPEPYARAYHDLYQLIKAHDPTARIFAGNIVQPTPLRLQYLDRVLVAYQQLYGDPMPVDGWGIHNFMLAEANSQRCDDPEMPEDVRFYCGWGADVPTGFNQDEDYALYGEIVSIDDNANMVIFRERIVRFRQWMADNGYRDKPLHVTEYGVLMPPDFGFPVPVVNTFMSASFDYMLSATDAALGYPADSNRLVQKWSWYSSSDQTFNGWLFENGNLTAMGANYADYTSGLSGEVDIAIQSVNVLPPVLVGNPVTVTLQAVLVNNGVWEEPIGPLIVSFFTDDPQNGGVLIGTEQLVTLGAGQQQIAVTVSRAGLTPGVHPVYVQVGMADQECNELNNVWEQPVIVGGYAQFLPLINKQ